MLLEYYSVYILRKEKSGAKLRGRETRAQGRKDVAWNRVGAKGWREVGSF